MSATIATAIVAAVGALGFAVPASAAPLVDPDALGSLTIHKLESPDSPTGLPNNGTEVDVSGLIPMEGIEFTLQQVNDIDLSTNAGWAAAADLSALFDAGDPVTSIENEGYTLGAPVVDVTDANGETDGFVDLPVGLYLVQETSYPSGVTPSAPFLVTIPLTDPTNTDNWLYDVHAYPKNSVSTATKTVEDGESIQLGDAVTWTITADIPNEAVIDGYKIVDVLDSKLDYVGSTVSLADGTTITEGTDYTIVFDDASNTVTVEFTEAGRAILAANNTTQVVVDIVTTVNEIGEISNEALLYPNAPSFEIEPGEPGGPTVTPETETRWGNITLEKTDEEGAALVGAVFQVFTTAEDAANQTNPVELDGQTSFEVTNPDGTLTIEGLRYSDFANGASVAPGEDDYIQYYLVEVKAPEGYELLAEPIEFTVDASTTTVGIDLSIENVPSNGGFALPMTGGMGTTLLYAAGFVLIAGGVVYLVLSRRRRQL